MTPSSAGRRPWTFYALAAGFAAYVIFLYGPMICIFILSFQGPQGGLVFPMRGESLHWFRQLINQADTGDMVGALQRSVPLALIVMVLTVAASMAAGLSFRRPFRGSGALFYTAIASLVAPGYVLGIGIGLMFAFVSFLGFESAAIYTDEARDGHRTVSKALIAAVLFIAVFYAITMWGVIIAFGEDKVAAAAGENPGTLIFRAFGLYMPPAFTVIAEFLKTRSCLSLPSICCRVGSVRYGP